LNHIEFISVCTSIDFHACGLGNEPGNITAINYEGFRISFS